MTIIKKRDERYHLMIYIFNFFILTYNVSTYNILHDIYLNKCDMVKD